MQIKKVEGNTKNVSYLVEKIRDGQAIPKVSSERRWVCYDVNGSTMNDFAWENETAEQVQYA